jgi:hypothetical protein
MVHLKFIFPLIVAAGSIERAFAFHISGMSMTSDDAMQRTNRRAFFQTAAATAVAFSFAPLKSQAFEVGGKIQFGGESIMVQKEHGTSSKPVQNDLLYGVSNKLADKISNYNR